MADKVYWCPSDGEWRSSRCCDLCELLADGDGRLGAYRPDDDDDACLPPEESMDKAPGVDRG